MDPKIDFTFLHASLDGLSVILLEIPRALRHPVRFRGTEFLRVGSYRKKLGDYPEKERELWRIFDQTPFEEGIAAEHLGSEDAIQLLDYPSYFDLLNVPLPDSREARSRNATVCDGKSQKVAVTYRLWTRKG